VREHARQAIRATYDMNVEMKNFLPSHASGIDDCAKTICTALLARQAWYQDHHAPE
jgi:hypothetical protein